MIEQHADGMIRFTVTTKAAAGSVSGETIDLEIEGRRVAGTVEAVKPGNGVCIIVVKPTTETADV